MRRARPHVVVEPDQAAEGVIFPAEPEQQPRRRMGAERPRVVPISTGSENDALLALLVVLRVPYPLSFYAKGLDGRIDDPNAGWKGRGVVDDKR
jgi:hypothetical protein